MKGVFAEGLQQRRERKGIGEHLIVLQDSRSLELFLKTMKFLNRAKALYHWVIVNGLLVYRTFINPKTPWYVRLLLLIPIAYLFIPSDFIADVIPLLGQLDDLAVLGYGYFILLRIVPKPVLEECRQKVQAKLDLRGGRPESPRKRSKDL